MKWENANERKIQQKISMKGIESKHNRPHSCFEYVAPNFLFNRLLRNSWFNLEKHFDGLTSKKLSCKKEPLEIFSNSFVDRFKKIISKSSSCFGNSIKTNKKIDPKYYS